MADKFTRACLWFVVVCVSYKVGRAVGRADQREA